MESADFLKLGAFCLMRMSLKAQRELLSLAEKGLSFTGPVLSELNGIDKGYDFVKACGGRLDLASFMDILTYCDLAVIGRIITENVLKEAFLQSAETSGYFVMANAAIYYTMDMAAALDWFKKVPGWPGVIEAKDDSGNGIYGLIEPHFKLNALGNKSPYMQMMRGEPVKPVAAMIHVWGLGSLRQRAIENGWKEMTAIEKTPWGASLFDMTTCDDTLLRFYEPDNLV